MSEEKESSTERNDDENSKEDDLGYFGHIMLKTEMEPTEEEKLLLEEENESNILSVAFRPAEAKQIISPHSFSILADKDPHVELAEPIIAQARQVFRSMADKFNRKKSEEIKGEEEEKDTHTPTLTLPRKNMVPLLVSMGYDHDDEDTMQDIVDSLTQKEVLDEDEWCMLLEEYQVGVLSK